MFSKETIFICAIPFIMIPGSIFCFYKLFYYYTIQVNDKEKYTIYFDINDNVNDNDNDNNNVNEIKEDYILSKITNISKSISRRDSEYKSFSLHKEKIDEFEIDKNDIENIEIIMKICEDAIKYNNSTDINNRVPIIKFMLYHGFGLTNFFGTFYYSHIVYIRADENKKIPGGFDINVEFLHLMSYKDHIDEFFDYKDPRNFSVKEIRDKVTKYKVTKYEKIPRNKK